MQMKHRSSRGVSLVEAMVALAVMAFGMLAVVGVQSTLRYNGDVARQRSEATRLAQEKLDALRSFTTIDTGPAEHTWANIANQVATENGLNAVYEVRSEIVTLPDTAAKVIRVTVSWADRAAADANDKNQRVVLSSTIAGAAPGLSGTLVVRQAADPRVPQRRPMQRHPTIPASAKDMGNGLSGFVPPGRPTMALVFNNLTGMVTGVCNFNYSTGSDNLTNSELQACANTITGQLLSGFVRFQQALGGPDLTAADVENPPGPALNLRMQISLSSSGHPQSPFCVDDATIASTSGGQLAFVTYYCVIYSNDLGAWSGTTTIAPRTTDVGNWIITDDTSAVAGTDIRYRVCRYTTASSNLVSVSNRDHPLSYSQVSGNLTDQNFVVIHSVKHCPTDVAADPANGDFVNSNTLQHQP